MLAFIWDIVNNQKKKKKKKKKKNNLSCRGLVNWWKGEVPPNPFIGLRSARDKSVYFWLWDGYLVLYKAIIVREN